MGSIGTLLLGHATEALVCDKLREEGMVILEQNYRSGRYEIDIIAMDGRVLTFIEVKTRPFDVQMEEVGELITPAKERRLVAAADAYCRSYRAEYESCRFDFVFVTDSGKDLKIMHFREAFIPSMD